MIKSGKCFEDEVRLVQFVVSNVAEKLFDFSWLKAVLSRYRVEKDLGCLDLPALI
jgi:hypothetical protein